MKSKDIRKEKQNSKLKSVQFKEGSHVYYVFYNDQSAQVKQSVDGQLFVVGTYKVNKKLWIKGDKHYAPESIRNEVERLYS
ncbi:hypothetical protein IKG38_01655 [Candidatus Saccharibacteria bacterium]|nr:hypothetical protein [Candidatus Saccharibacteria bacterium]